VHFKLYLLSCISSGRFTLFVADATVPSSGPAGTFVAISDRFAPVNGYFDDLHVATIVRQRLGNWNTAFQMPNVSVGNHTIRTIEKRGRGMIVASFHALNLPSASPCLTPVWFVHLDLTFRAETPHVVCHFLQSAEIAEPFRVVI
jgi:hypothetical protein